MVTMIEINRFIFRWEIKCHVGARVLVALV